MSSRVIFLYEEEKIEGYEETAEVKSIFGKFIGYHAYLIFNSSVLELFKMDGEYIVIETKNTDKLPKKFKIWGDAILDFEWDGDELIIKLEGGHFITRQIISNDFSKMVIF